MEGTGLKKKSKAYGESILLCICYTEPYLSRYPQFAQYFVDFRETKNGFRKS